MNNPVCSNCGAPLDPTAAACSRCGMPMSQMPGQSHDQPNDQPQGQQPSPGQGYAGQGYGGQGYGGQGPEGQAYGSQGHQGQAYGGPAYGSQGPAHGGQAYGNQGYGVGYAQGYPQGQPGAGMPGPEGPGRRKPWLVPAIIAGVLVLIGAAVLIVVLLTNGDDDDKSDGPKNDPTAQATDGPTDEPTDGLTQTPTPAPVPTAPTPTTPTAPPTNGGDLSLRSAPVGSDEEQIKQLTEEFSAWYSSVTSGGDTTCSEMDQFFLEPEDSDVKGCASASTLDAKFKFDITDIKVSGDTATGTMNSTITVGGSTPQSSSDDVKLAKRDGYWFFDE